MESNILVSVIIPVYNSAKYLRECLDSVINQTLREIEIICVDDGSTDNSLAIIQEIAQKDSRVQIIEQENAGAGAARNRGLKVARGKYLSFLDSDDFFAFDMLEKAVSKAEEEGAEIVVFRSDFYRERTGTYAPCTYALREELLPDHRPFAGTDVRKNIFRTVVGWAWDKIFLGSFILNNNIWFQEQRTSNDLLFVFSAMVKAERISTLSMTLAHHRQDVEGALSVTREKSWMCFYNALIALREQLIAWNLYRRFEQDYINYALHFSLWNLNTLKEPIKTKLYKQLKSEWFRNLGIIDLPKEDFYNKHEYAQFEEITKNKGYWLARRVLSGVKRRLKAVWQRIKR